MADEGLRSELRAAAADLRKLTDFGLVFESHIPETVRLPHHPIRRGVKVTYRDGTDGSIFEVAKVNGAKVTMSRVRSADGAALSAQQRAELDDETAELEALVVIAEFGDPIYPGLRHLGSVSRGGDRPAHVVINGENHHALEALQFTHAGKVDCIYIDPPYNSGARDWKYSNDYVDAEDAYRHSKWLAFMERRLKLAKALLKPENSVLMVAIDENEVHHLALLLHQLFPTSKVQMVTALSNPAGASIIDQFDRVDDHLLFVNVGSSRPIRTTTITTPLASVGSTDDSTKATRAPRAFVWESMQRSGGNSRRQDTKAKFFPIYIDEINRRVVGCGDHLQEGMPRSAAPPPPDRYTEQWPIKRDGSEACWQLSAPTFRRYLSEGRIRLGNRKAGGGWGIGFLTKGHMRAVAAGELVTFGRDEQGALIVERASDKLPTRVGKTMWTSGRYSATEHGSTLLRRFLPMRKFPFPKSLYSAEDALRFYVRDNREAVILDFFAGSGTTAHAVARLNHQDGGRRQSITVTNNEVAEAEAKALRNLGLRPGDPEWEALGIFEHITRPRVTAATTGQTPEGSPVTGEYRFTDEFPMAEGFEENVEFFELTYLDASRVEVNLAFAGIAPLLWLRAGGRGPIIDECVNGNGRRKPYSWTDRYGVLFNCDRWRGFVSKLPATATTVFIVTDSTTEFAHIAGELPGDLDVVRLYERYLTTFAVNER